MWNVTEPDVHISGNTAWIAYVNQGSITDASGTVSQKWLESAFLQKQGGIWKIVFMHSTRVPVAPPESHGKLHDVALLLMWSIREEFALPTAIDLFYALIKQLPSIFLRGGICSILALRARGQIVQLAL